MEEETTPRKLVIKTRHGKAYHTWRKYKELRNGDIILNDGIDISIIIDGNFEELNWDELDNIIDSKYRCVEREYKLNRILPECIRQAQLNYLLKNI